MTKVIILDDGGQICASVVQHTGAEHRRLANRVMEEALGQVGIEFSEVVWVIATGYGRINVPFADRQLTELTCHTRGIVHFFPSVRTAIDIGGQDAKALKIRDGKLVDFVMNDKCAAGTGRFLEVLAGALGLKLDELGEISAQSRRKVRISSICTVFAQGEVINLIAKGVPLPDIVAGLHDAISNRIARLVRRIGIEPDVVLTGGVAKNSGVVRAMAENLGTLILVPENPLITGALGAALLGREMVLKMVSRGEPVPKKERRLEEATFFTQGQVG